MKLNYHICPSQRFAIPAGHDQTSASYTSGPRVGQNRGLRPLVLVPLIAALLMAACSSPEEGDDPCADTPISGSLKPVFYWGEATGIDSWEVNSGTPVESGRFAQWLSAAELIMSTRRLINGVIERGLVVLSLGPDGSVESWQWFSFDHEIWFMRVFESSGAIWLLYFEDGTATYPRLGLASLSSGNVEIQNLIVDETWRVRGFDDWNNGEAVLVHARRPSDSQAGFFAVTGSGDSLIYPINMSAEAQRGMDLSVDSERLYWGLTIGELDESRTWLLCLSLVTEPLQPVILIDVEGEFVSVAVDPTNRERLILNRTVYEGGSPRESIVELYDVATGTARKLDVRTNKNPCSLTQNEFPFWHQDGNAIVFRSWAGSLPEPSRVWVRASIP